VVHTRHHRRIHMWVYMEEVGERMKIDKEELKRLLSNALGNEPYTIEVVEDKYTNSPFMTLHITFSLLHNQDYDFPKKVG
jgi:hypothetical protein